VLDDIRDLLLCKNCVLSVADMSRDMVRAEITVGIEPYWRQLMQGYGADIAAVYRAVPDFLTRPLDEPFVLRKDVPDAVLLANRYYREWAVPNGMVDAIQTFLMRDSRRNAALALGRHESAGLITEREVSLMRLIAPHVRQAVIISDLIDMQRLHAGALDATLDILETGVVIVAKDGAILHANEAARRMLESGEPIVAREGGLRAYDRSATDRLKHALTAAGDNESEIGTTGLGLSLPGASGQIATAHVLPLGQGDVRARLVPRAAAAVFVATEERAFAGNLEPVGEAFGLTAGELRLLDRLMMGEPLAEAAAALGIARTTAKTHLLRILAKTGTHRQTKLLDLVHRLVPAVGVAKKTSSPESPPTPSSPASPSPPAP
jgi:DNA-binding CsgD family transcriptional regulator/PAS domain-containing protein